MLVLQIVQTLLIATFLIPTIIFFCQPDEETKDSVGMIGLLVITLLSSLYFTWY